MTRRDEWGRPGPVKVLLADDQALVRAGFKVLLDVEDDLTVVAEAGDGAEAVALARRHRPEVVLMDIRMPVLDGIQATRQLAATGGLEGLRVLILTTYDSDAYRFAALAAGPAGSCSRTAARPSCCTASGWSRPGRRCWRPGSPAG